MSYGLVLRKIYRFIKTRSFQTKDYNSYKKFLLENQNKYNKNYFNLTIDFELGWSRARRGKSVTTKEESLERSRLARRMLPVLLELSEKYKIPITFATVAHVALDNCSEHEITPKFAPFWLQEDWYKTDPKSNLSQNKDFYGKDLIQKIIKSPVSHEIASHGFSHIDLGDSETTKEVAEFEISESTKILKKVYPELCTFVFPNNYVSFLETVKNNGYGIYRVKENISIKKDKNGLFMFPLGLWVSPDAFSSKDIISLINISIARGQLVNIWLHLYEFKSEQQFRSFFETVFSHLEICKENGIIEVQTIKDIIKSLNE